MKRKTYTSRCHRGWDWWAISVPELKGVYTQAGRLVKAEAKVRGAIAFFLRSAGGAARSPEEGGQSPQGVGMRPGSCSVRRQSPPPRLQLISLKPLS